ncbi:hypothetical protein SLEP1_g13379 [Rubroshorea leprosula]|uniref:Uncharacterized protein n=1 Tax=Rubroshorea leprosula TaxID=152421 RepID=A0AAV5ILE1_9ROSI|nr:hypothetical protein SLEP1_g13379 [Rubroshorea leprosula]
MMNLGSMVTKMEGWRLVKSRPCTSKPGVLPKAVPAQCTDMCTHVCSTRAMPGQAVLGRGR